MILDKAVLVIMLRVDNDSSAECKIMPDRPGFQFTGLQALWKASVAVRSHQLLTHPRSL